MTVPELHCTSYNQPGTPFTREEPFVIDYPVTRHLQDIYDMLRPPNVKVTLTKDDGGVFEYEVAK